MGYRGIRPIPNGILVGPLPAATAKHQDESPQESCDQWLESVERSRVDGVGDPICGGALPWCTTPKRGRARLGRDWHHPIISPSGIPSAVMVFRILHPILASTLCDVSPLARIAGPTAVLYL